MVRGFILAGIRRRAGRSLALVAGLLLAATGFTVLTGATTTSRLRVDGLVEGTGRPAYDLLIRPRGVRSADEDARRVVRANALSGQYGGITEDDLRVVTDTPGVEAAAPIAMIGYANTQLSTNFDLTGAVDRGRDRQILRVDPTYLADRGLSSARGPASYLYVTTHPLLFVDRSGRRGRLRTGTPTAVVCAHPRTDATAGSSRWRPSQTARTWPSAASCDQRIGPVPPIWTSPA